MLDAVLDAAHDAGRDGSLVEARVVRALAHHADGDADSVKVGLSRSHDGAQGQLRQGLDVERLQGWQARGDSGGYRDRFAPARDADGDALGGVRQPHVEAVIGGYASEAAQAYPAAAGRDRRDRGGWARIGMSSMS